MKVTTHDWCGSTMYRSKEPLCRTEGGHTFAPIIAKMTKHYEDLLEEESNEGDEGGF